MKIILQLISFRFLFGLTPTLVIMVQREHLQNSSGIGMESISEQKTSSIQGGPKK